MTVNNELEAKIKVLIFKNETVRSVLLQRTKPTPADIRVEILRYHVLLKNCAKKSSAQLHISQKGSKNNMF